MCVRSCGREISLGFVCVCVCLGSVSCCHCCSCAPLPRSCLAGVPLFFFSLFCEFFHLSFSHFFLKKNPFFQCFFFTFSFFRIFFFRCHALSSRRLCFGLPSSTRLFLGKKQKSVSYFVMLDCNLWGCQFRNGLSAFFFAAISKTRVVFKTLV